MPKKILIVDDEPHIILLLEQTLEDFEDMGVEILTAGNGREALEVVRTERPDLLGFPCDDVRLLPCGFPAPPL
jgi:CheY-like chemotaxis protein